MSEPRLNHSAVRYGKYISVVGGHGLINGIPTYVSGALSFSIFHNEKEIYSPYIGT